MPLRPARVRLAGALALAGALLVPPVATAQADTPPGPAAPSAVASGRDDPAPRVVRDGSGRPRLLGARPGRALAAAPAGVSSPELAAQAHLRRFGAALGLSAAQVRGLRTERVTSTPGGHDVVRLQQTVDGVPVLGAQVVAVLDGSAALLSLGGEASRRVDSATYDVPAARAARLALRTTARAHGLRHRSLRAARPARWLFDPALVDPDGREGARAVWRVEVTAPERLDVRELVLVDAASGTVTLQVDQVAHLLDRVVCDHADAPSRGFACKPGQYTRVEGSGPTGIVDVDQAYDLTGSTADWFATRLGVDLTELIGADHGDGRKLRSTTRYCPAYGCPMDNAFWSGDQMVYGSGFTSADDVVAHELSHGVTQRTTGLIYWYQSGAINESMSDVFGELVDLANGLGNDSPDVRWELGEDLGPRAGGVARDMADPPRFGQPDQTGSDLYDFASDYDDNGGVHTNSGVPNKTAYLVADGTAAEPGGTFNGRAFAGIGTDKAGFVYWAALQMLTPGADFTDLAAALQQGCANLAGAGAGGVTATDCQSVAAATEATGLTRWASPDPPREVRMTTGLRSVQLRWEPPQRPGSSPITSYAVHVRPPLGEDDFYPVEPSARRFRLEGLLPATDYTIGLVAVTADGTSPSVVRSFAGSALRMSWPSPVPYGGVARFRGSLTGAGAAPLAGRPVHLLARERGTSGYAPVDRVSTAPDGSFVLRTRPRRAATYVVAFGGSQRVIGARSPRHLVPVRPLVRVAAEDTVPLGATISFRGSVAPFRARGPVRLQRQLEDGSWRTVTRGRLGGDGRFVLTARASTRPEGTWRVAVPSAATGLGAVSSREVTVRVR